LARREFGLMAPVVFDLWGVRKTDDFGEIVFGMIDAGILFKTDADRKDDFNDVFALGPALTDNYSFPPTTPTADGACDEKEPDRPGLSLLLFVAWMAYLGVQTAKYRHPPVIVSHAN